MHSLGFYDVSMLTDPDAKLSRRQNIPSITVSTDEDDAVPLLQGEDEAEEDLLHPDVLFESIMSEFRRRVTRARVQQLTEFLVQSYQQQPADVDEDIMIPESSKMIRARSNSPSLAVIRTKPDNFWIKDFPSSPMDTTAQATGSPLGLEAAASDQAVLIAGVTVTESSTDPADQTTATPPGPAPTDSPSDPSGPANLLSPQPNIPEHYRKEEIPWSPGTVRRTTQEMEERFRSDSVSSFMTEEGEGVVEEGSGEAGGWSVYEREEIALEPGIVMKTRTELEKRDRSVLKNQVFTL